MVLVLAIMMFIAFFAGVWFFVLRGESAGTDLMVKQLLATTAGEAAAAQISAHIHRWAWKDRFHKDLGTESPAGSGFYTYAFTDRDFPLAGASSLALGKLGRTSWQRGGEPQIAAIIRDLEQPRAYRIKMKITCSGTAVFMTWDKRWNQGLLGALNSANDTVVTRGDPPPADLVDRMIDDVKAAARKNSDAGSQILGDLDSLIDSLNSGQEPEILLVP